ncbi:MAG: 4Fe-4S binding protein [Methanomassiliicoccales archaeon]
MTHLYTRIIRKTFDKRFFMAKLTRLPILGQAMEFAFFEDDDIIILPKEKVAEKAVSRSRTIEINIRAEPENVVLPSAVIEYFVLRSRYIFIMDKCMCRDANHCENYPASLGCVFLGRGVLKIPKDMGRMATPEEALEHLRKCREAGLVHLIGRDKIDSVWLGTGPKEDLLSICSCCECCCLWKMLPELNESINATVTRMPGVELIIDQDKCVGCEKCVREGVCYVSAIFIKEGKARIELNLCKGCGRCVEICPKQAIEMHILESDFLQRTINRIQPLVNVSKP